MTQTTACPVSDWHGCYDESWKGVIVDEAFAHPAKFSRGLIRRIVQHGLERGYWAPGATIGDCFGGVGLGGIECASKGLGWIGAELEPRFVELADQNFAKHRHLWETCGDPLPVIVQGDSRRFAEIVGEVAGVVTSPPWEKNSEGALRASKFKAPEDALQAGRGHGCSDEARLRQLARDENKTYGDSEGQVGNDSGEDYWSACKTVYEQVRIALKPGGLAAIVVKDFVKSGQRVPLCDQTCQLLESLGFEVFERTRCWLVKERRQPGLFGGEHVERKERKSFFRRLAESKGSPRIDWEEVIWARTT